MKTIVWLGSSQRGTSVRAPSICARLTGGGLLVPRKTDPSHTRRGHTLIELVIVVLILGIVVSVAGVRYAGALAYHQTQAAARRVAADLETARQAARSRGQAVSLAFDTAQDRYTITGLPNPDRSAAAYIVALNDGSLQADLTSAALGGDATINFNGYGMPDSGGSLTLKSGDVTQTITIQAGTGAVSIP